MKKILIIDTDIDLINNLGTQLSQAGYMVEAQTTAQAGLASAADASLIIAAVELPDQNGFILCANLKRNPQTAYIPIFLTSSSDNQAAFEQHSMLANHADGYFLKPIAIDIMMQEIQSIFEEIDQYQQQQAQNYAMPSAPAPQSAPQPPSNPFSAPAPAPQQSAQPQNDPQVADDKVKSLSLNNMSLFKDIDDAELEVSVDTPDFDLSKPENPLPPSAPQLPPTSGLPHSPSAPAVSGGIPAAKPAAGIPPMGLPNSGLGGAKPAPISSHVGGGNKLPTAPSSRLPIPSSSGTPSVPSAAPRVPTMNSPSSGIQATLNAPSGDMPSASSGISASISSSYPGININNGELVDALQKEITSLKVEFEKISNKNKNLNAQLQELNQLQQDMAALKVENETLTSKNKNLTAQLENLAQMEQDMASLKVECDNLNNMNKNLTMQLQGYAQQQQEFAQMQMDYEAQIQGLSQQTQGMATIQADFDKLSQEHQSLKSEFDNLSAKNQTLVSQINHFAQDMLNLTKG